MSFVVRQLFNIFKSQRTQRRQINNQFLGIVINKDSRSRMLVIPAKAGIHVRYACLALPACPEFIEGSMAEWVELPKIK